MKTALILTLGFDERFCFRALLRHEIKEGDEIVLITAGLVDKVKKAYEWIKTVVERSYDVKIKLIEIDVKNLMKAILDVVNLLDEYKDWNVIVNLSGGMRILTIIMLFALTIKSMRHIKVEIELEDLSALIEIPTQLFVVGDVKSKLTNEKIEILKLISQFEEVKKIVEVLGKDASTIRRHIASLVEMGLVNVEKRKPLKVKLTDFGELILKVFN
ncbi:MAG TPA: CRISPR locus-related DNA-binding protein [Archaeoglobus profundus]|nr:CRISPR locus-related DNA-binding protein [Archaeoglobus profundus]